jgi:asparagine synthase (glutamine-hydrolysing)
MCGITALIQPNGTQVNRHLFTEMNNTLTHRGPDGSGTWIEGNAALGSRRLSIIDLTGGRQPMVNENKSLVIVFNGEIYNYRQLKKQLEPYHRFTTNSDTETILHLFEDKGEDTPKYLDGLFAFTIYNRETKMLFAARDHLGIKPLYYYLRGGTLIVSSEPRAIIQHPVVHKNLDLAALRLLLLLEHIPSPASIWQGMRKLPPGHWLKFKNGVWTLQRYWQPTFTPKLDLDKTELLAQLENHLQSAVGRSLVADVPVGSLLSGGIDSSMVTALVTRLHPKVHTFSIGFDDPSYDEAPYARRVADYLGTTHHQQIFTEKEVQNTIPTLARHMDEPLADYSLLPMLLLAKFTQSFVKVALSGDGGDELLGGYPTHWAHQVFPLWDNSPQLLKNLALTVSGLIFPVSEANFSLRFITRKFTSGDPDPRLRELLWPGAFTLAESSAILSHPPTLPPNFPDSPDIPDLPDSLRSLRLRYYLGEQILTKVDRASMHHSLELRPPYLSVPLVEFATKIPERYLVSFFRTKMLFKEIAHRYLPAEIVHRRKKGFGIPLARWLNTGLNPLLHDLLDPARLKQQALFNPKPIARLITDHERHRENNYKQLWTLMTFQLWYRRWLS